MNKIKGISALMLALMLVVQPAYSADEGQAAPDFALTGSDGKTYSLSEFRNKKTVVIAFFPKAFTGG